MHKESKIHVAEYLGLVGSAIVRKLNIVNVGAGADLKISELATLVQDIVGFAGRVAWDTNKPDGTPQKLMDTSKLNSLGWRPTIDLAEGIASSYRHYLLG